MDVLGAAGCAALGAGYVLVAKKRVSTLTPVKPRWRPRRRMPAEGVVNRTLRQNRCDSENGEKH